MKTANLFIHVGM